MALGVCLDDEARLERNRSAAYFVGDSLTFCDAAVWDVLDAMVTYIDGAPLDESPRVAAFYASFAERPEVAEYLAQRPPK